MMPDHVHPIDRAIIADIVDGLLARGLSISVEDEEGCALRLSRERDAIILALAAADMDWLVVYRPIRPGFGPYTRQGMVMLVYGNEPGVVVSDYSENPDIAEVVEAAIARQEAA